MRLRRFRLGAIALGFGLAVTACAAPSPEPTPSPEPPTAVEGTPSGGLSDWVADIRLGLSELSGQATGADTEAPLVQQRVLDLYLGRQEYIERYYGLAGAGSKLEALSSAVLEAEAAFHTLLGLASTAPRVDSEEWAGIAADIDRHLSRALLEAAAAGLPVDEPPLLIGGPESEESGASLSLERQIAALATELEEAEREYRIGSREAALARIERAYLELFEPLEPRLEPSATAAVEHLIHLQLRPAVSRGDPVADVEALFADLNAALAGLKGDRSTGGSLWFGAFSAFSIVLREGLEAVLIIGAILACLGRVSEDHRQRRPVHIGLWLGIAASLGTWLAARHLIPVSGADRELIEGVTALLAVAVLLYVSNWLFRKAYLHDWREYVEARIGKAATTGSGWAIGGLAFAVVYREGFETVLFLQALVADTSAVALLAGLIPAFAVILAIAFGIIRLGLRLPLRQVFAWTNAVLVYLAAVLLGKGLYSLMEAGVFVPNPLRWVPDHEALRQFLGFYPILQTLVAQLALLSLVGATYGLYRYRSVRTLRARPAPALNA